MPGRRNSARDLRDTVEALTATLAMVEREGDFYRRSGNATTHEDVRAVLIEVANELDSCHKRLESSRSRLAREP